MRSDSRHSAMWPAEWPGTSSTVKPATSSPSFSARSTLWPGPVNTLCISWAIGWSGWRSPIRSGFSAGGTSSSGTQNGTPNSSHTRWLAPWWSGWAWVMAWADRSRPRSSLRITPVSVRPPASTSTSPTR